MNIIDKISEMTMNQRLKFEHDWEEDAKNRSEYADGDAPFQVEPWQIVVAEEA